MFESNNYIDYVDEDNEEAVLFLLLEKNIINTTNTRFVLRRAVCKGSLNVFKLLVKHSGLSLSIDKNIYIKLAVERKQENVLKYLWNNKDLRKTLKKDNESLYREIKEKYKKESIIETALNF